YLSGAYRPELVGIEHVGFMMTPNVGNAHPAGSVWAADSGLYSSKGVRSFDLDRYVAWLTKRAPHQNDCLFATAPDVVGAWQETLARSLPVLPTIRSLGYRAALVGQDGLTDTTQLPWDDFDCLFIGGTNQFKLAEP